jgi:hypothetical protein
MAIFPIFAVLMVTASMPLSEERLIEEVRAIDAPADHRQTHVSSALSGTFAELALPRFERLAPISKGQYGEPTKALGAYARGERSWASLSPELRDTFARALPDVLGLLRASRAASGRLESNLTGAMRLEDPFPEDSTPFAMKIAAAEVRRELEAHAPGALTTCTDALATARDLSFGNALSRMMGVGAIQALAPVCNAAVQMRRPDVASCAALHSVAAHTAPLSVMFQQEKLFGELTFFGSTLSAETRAQLPPEARRVLDQHEQAANEDVHFASLRSWLFGAWARRDLVERMNAIIAVVDQSPSVADPIVSKLDDEGLFWSHRLLGIDGEPTRWMKFVTRVRKAQAQLDSLAAECDSARASARSEP